MNAVVFDIGGTKTRAARLSDSLIDSIESIQTPSDPEEGFHALRALIETAAQGDADIIAGGIAGVIGKEGKVYHSPNLPNWDGAHLGAFLRDEICKDVLIANDAALAGLGEALYGAGAEYRIVAYIGIGTGIGGVRVTNGEIDEHAWGFEPGQHILDIPNNVTFEKSVAGDALFKKYRKHPKDLERSVYESLTPTLAAGLYNVLLFWSPDALILDGSLMNEENGFRLDEVTRALAAQNKMLPQLPDIKKASLGDSAGLYGARALIERYRKEAN